MGKAQKEVRKDNRVFFIDGKLLLPDEFAS